MKAFIECVVKELVDYPDQVSIREISSDHTSVFQVHLHPADNGKVIGKQGHTILAIRTLLSSVAAKNGKRAMLELIEPEGYVRPQRPDDTLGNR